ncbi:hypothetical protein ACIBPB_31985 [Micromonospora sp. NPDC049836]
MIGREEQRSIGVEPPGVTVRVYFNSNFAGASQDFAAGAKGDLKPP